MFFSSFSLKKPQQPNSLQDNHFMSDTEANWAFMLAVAQRGIHNWSGSRGAGSAASTAAAGALGSDPLGSPSPRGGRIQCQVQRMLPTPIRSTASAPHLRAAGTRRGTTSPPVLRQRLKAPGTPGWAEPHSSSSSSTWRSPVLTAGFRPSKSIPEREGGRLCHSGT